MSRPLKKIAAALRALAQQASALADETEQHIREERARLDGGEEPATPQVEHPAAPARPTPPPPAPAVDPDSAGYEYHAPQLAAPTPTHPPPAPAAAPSGGTAVENARALVAAGVARPGARGTDGRLHVSQYGGPTDHTPDDETRAGFGNRGNKLTPASIAISRDIVHEMGLHGGEVISVEVGGHAYPLGVYDDTSAARITNNVDVYDPGDALGRDTFLAVIAAGTWKLVASSGQTHVGGAAPERYAGPHTYAESVALALADVNRPITYALGSQLPGARSDCSGAVDFWNGISRASTGLNTDGMVKDAKGAHRYYEEVTGPAKPGYDLVVPSGAGLSYGHTAKIVAVDAGKPTRIVDCSHGNPEGRSVQEKGPEWFEKHGGIIVRAVALVD